MHVTFYERLMFRHYRAQQNMVEKIFLQIVELRHLGKSQVPSYVFLSLYSIVLQPEYMVTADPPTADNSYLPSIYSRILVDHICWVGATVCEILKRGSLDQYTPEKMTY